MREKAAQERRLLWAKRSAIHYLGSYASSEENLRRTMLRRALRKFEGIDEDEAAALAEEAVRFCCENGFLDDGTYARAKAASGEGRGHSKRRIRMSLIAKGIDPETAAEAASQVDDMKAAAAFAKRRRIGPWRKGQGDREDMRREAAALGRAGFPGDIAFRVVTMDLSKAEDLLYGPAAPVS